MVSYWTLWALLFISHWGSPSLVMNHVRLAYLSDVGQCLKANLPDVQAIELRHSQIRLATTRDELWRVSINNSFLDIWPVGVKESMLYGIKVDNYENSSVESDEISLEECERPVAISFERDSYQLKLNEGDVILALIPQAGHPPPTPLQEIVEAMRVIKFGRAVGLRRVAADLLERFGLLLVLWEIVYIPLRVLGGSMTNRDFRGVKEGQECLAI